MNTFRKENKTVMANTLCAKCSNACGRCAWSALMIPVAGWTAKKTKINAQHNREPLFVETYRVIECPLFQADKEQHTETIRTDKVKTLIYAILIRAVSDYATYQIKLAKSAHPTAYLLQNIREVERFLNAPMTADMLNVCGLGMDPQLIIDAVKADPHGVIERLRINYGETQNEEPKQRGRKRSNCWDNPRLQINKAERKNRL